MTRTIALVSFLVFIDFAHTETSIDSIHIDDDIAISGKHLDPRQTLNSDFFFTAQWFNPTAGTTFNLEQSESDTDLIFQIKTFQTIPEIALILCQLNPGGNPSIIKIDNIINVCVKFNGQGCDTTADFSILEPNVNSTVPIAIVPTSNLPSNLDNFFYCFSDVTSSAGDATCNPNTFSPFFNFNGQPASVTKTAFNTNANLVLSFTSPILSNTVEYGVTSVSNTQTSTIVLTTILDTQTQVSTEVSVRPIATSTTSSTSSIVSSTTTTLSIPTSSTLSTTSSTSFQSSSSSTFSSISISISTSMTTTSRSISSITPSSLSSSSSSPSPTLSATTSQASLTISKIGLSLSIIIPLVFLSFLLTFFILYIRRKKVPPLPARAELPTASPVDALELSTGTYHEKAELEAAELPVELAANSWDWILEPVELDSNQRGYRRAWSWESGIESLGKAVLGIWNRT